MITFREVIQREKEHLRVRRQKLGIEHGNPEAENWFGIALSGGGIRSATINLGILKPLHRFGVLKRADYLSSVSGGGYTHAYVQATTKEAGNMDTLFSEEHVDVMRQHGEYMTPGQGFWKTSSTLLLVVAFVVSWCMSLINPLIVGGILYYAYSLFTALFNENPLVSTLEVASELTTLLMYVAAGIFSVHFITNVYLTY